MDEFKAYRQIPGHPDQRRFSVIAVVNPNVDKRTKRKQDAKEFEAAIAEYRRSLPQKAPAAQKGTGGRVHVCIRKRPMFAHEAHERQEFDVVTCVSGSGGGQAMAF